MQKQKELRIVFGVPSMGMWHTPFALSLMNLALAFNTYKVEGYDKNAFRVCSTLGSILAKSRWEIVKAAKEFKADYLLFLDSDHTFPRNLLHRLLAHKKDVVACNLVTKTIPASPTARAKGGGNFGIPVFSDPGVEGLEEVWRVGTGIMLIKMSVFDRVPMENLFAVTWKPDVENYQGEDWRMCEEFEKAGIKMFVDHGLSRECGHIGFLEYTHDYVGEIMRDAA